jgi:hypothetical protein
LSPGWYSNSITVATTPGAPTTGSNPCRNNAPLSFASGTTVLCPGIYFLDGEDNQGEALIISNTATVSVGTAGVNGCPSNGLDGVTFIASCSTAGCTSGGGFAVGGTGSNNPNVQLRAPSTALAGSGVPAEILFDQIFATADTAQNHQGSTSFGGTNVSLNGVIHIPANPINLQGGATFGSCTEMIAASFSVQGNVTMTRPTCGVLTNGAAKIALVE